MRYIVITNTSLGKLQMEVNDKLKEGYELQGGISAISTKSALRYGEEYNQAMINKELKG